MLPDYGTAVWSIVCSMQASVCSGSAKGIQERRIPGFTDAGLAHVVERAGVAAVAGPRFNLNEEVMLPATPILPTLDLQTLL
ncbi:MAG: hypothetical protein ACREA0_28320 [bacterium]